MADRVVVVVGTRPEAIKLAPVCRSLAVAELTPVLVSTGQHADLLAGALAAFGLTPAHDLKVAVPGQTPAGVVARVLDRLTPLLTELRPVAVLVQGDTATALAGGLAGFYAGVPVGHVEAGLRTHDLSHPFPEEAHRQLVARVSRWHFAPTQAAAAHLAAEGIPTDRVTVTGNTGIDALLAVLASDTPAPSGSPFVLVTLHRRESFGAPLRAVLGGLRDFLDSHPDARAVWPVHPNPAVAEAAAEVLAGCDRVERVLPMGYRDFAAALACCRLVLTDSGGVQEEAPSLGKRVLVARDETERPEAVTAGLNRLVGTDRSRVATELARAWAEPGYSGPFPAPNPYGDGRAADRVASVLAGIR